MHFHILFSVYSPNLNILLPRKLHFHLYLTSTDNHDCPKMYFPYPCNENIIDIVQIKIFFCVSQCFPSSRSCANLDGNEAASSNPAASPIIMSLIACSMVQCVMWVHWSTKTHAISPSKRCLAMLHKAHLICITLAL